MDFLGKETKLDCKRGRGLSPRIAPRYAFNSTEGTPSHILRQSSQVSLR